MLYYINFVPPVIVQIIPIAVLLATISLFRKLSVNNEYVAMVGGGFSLKNMLIPLVISALIIGAVSFVIHNFIAPRAYFNQERIKAEKFVKADRPSRKIIKDINLIGKEDQLIYIKAYYIDKKIAKGITIIQNSADKLHEKRFMAASAEWNGRHWIFKEVNVFDRRTGYISEKTVFYPKIQIDIPIKPDDLLFSKNNPEIMSLSQLSSLSKRIVDKKSSFSRKLKVEYHYRFAFSFVSLVVLFVSVPFGLMQKRGPKFLSVGIGVVISLFYYIVLYILISFGKGKGFSPFLSAWGANFIFSAFAYVMFYITPK